MKVGIITRHAVANYGSILQAYATQKAIQNFGFESEIINYIRYDEQGDNIAKTMLKRNKFWNKNNITRLIYLKLQTSNYKKSYEKFLEFRKGFLNETEVLYSSNNELIKNIPNEDIYCTGSDQVWGRIGLSEFDRTYFLDFVPTNKKCISYASSFRKRAIE